MNHTEKESPRVAVVGAGAIGGVVAAFLARGGWDLEVVCKHQETVKRAVSEGFHISGVRGEHRIPLRTVKEIHELSGPKEVVFLATKANDAVEAGRALLPFLRETSVVVSLSAAEDDGPQQDNGNGADGSARSPGT